MGWFVLVLAAGAGAGAAMGVVFARTGTSRVGGTWSSGAEAFGRMVGRLRPASGAPPWGIEVDPEGVSIVSPAGVSVTVTGV